MTIFQRDGKISLTEATSADLAGIKDAIKHLAAQEGFVAVGIVPTGPVAEAERFMRFLSLGYHAGMDWLVRNSKQRCDTRFLLPEGAGKVGSIICLAISYAPFDREETSARFWIARYARGRDYHRILHKRCKRIVSEISKLVSGLFSRICVDTAPLLERSLAAAAGLGWIGKNGCLVNPKHGSYLLLAEIITNLPLEPDKPMENGCLSCQACVESCPTRALTGDGLLDANRCVSYLTIEHRGIIPDEFKMACSRWLFGCDTCQEACRYNRNVPAGDAELITLNAVAKITPRDVLKWSKADWDRFTRGLTIRRAKYEMFLRNAAIAAVSEGGDDEVKRLLMRLSRHESPIVADAARWSLSQLRVR
ncbi:MAG: tRNA epoxyqueuosine(34) reductase QueG [Planctomycetes bacterium]|nr:tRNA epoxyqueuosine(34) reductase QueG [Planctomycetota bacterium]